VPVTLWEAVLLGVVQGVFMFFPVSSTSHLVLVQHALARRGSPLPPPESPEMVLFDMVVHVGTLVSIAVVLRASLGRLLAGAWRDVRSFATRPQSSRTVGLRLRLCLLGLLSTAVTGAVGVLLRGEMVEAFAHPIVLAALLTVTGVLLWATDEVGPRWRGLRQITPAVAAGIGLAQAAALLPGLSRSGLTIAVALFLGLRRRWAAEYSFFIAIPTILAGTGVQAAFVLGDAGQVAVAPLAFGVGFVVAAVVGALALALVLRLLYRARFRYFSYYVWTLAGVVAVASTRGLL
jgi:undecaprenyl-diphosphatase